MSSIRLQIKDSIMHYLCDDWNNHKRGKWHKENQAIFDRKDGFACWCNTDLEMVMEKVVKGIYATDFESYEKQIRADAIEEFRRYLKTVVPCEMPQEIWNMGVDNTCDRMMKEKKNVRD